MLQYYAKTTRMLIKDKIEPDGIWYDLYCPEAEEIKVIEQMFQLKIPTPEDMHEIEASSRAFEDNGLFYLTASIVTSAGTENPSLEPVTFILNDKRLITVRYVDPKPFKTFVRRLERNKIEYYPEQIFVTILEVIVDRLADILEMTITEIDGISVEIFRLKAVSSSNQHELKEILTVIGKKGDLSTKLRESLENIGRLTLFFSNQLENRENRVKIKQLLRRLQLDVRSISNHVNFLFHKINFLLDATLGYINIEQNNVVKILSGAAVIFLPPTLIASIYGMNFKVMPELHWVFGYPLAICLMIIAAIAPYLYFKKKGWL